MIRDRLGELARRALEQVLGPVPSQLDIDRSIDAAAGAYFPPAASDVAAAA